MVADPTTFVLHYAPAIRETIHRLLKGEQDTDDVTQSFLAAVMHRGFSERQITRGRFRDFLRVAVRNAVIDHYRKKRLTSIDQHVLENTLVAPDDELWIVSWRACLLESAWVKLRQYQRATPGNSYHTILDLATQFPGEDSTEMARRASQAVARPLGSEAYRQQLHRARRKFAELLADVVRETLRDQDQHELADELRELGLQAYVQDYLPHLFRRDISSSD